MKVLIFGLGDLYNIGGVQLSYSWLFKYLDERGHRIVFCTGIRKETEKTYYYPFPESVSVQHIILKDSAKHHEEIRKLALKENPDVILLVYSGVWCLVLANIFQSLPYPVVISERGSASHCLQYLWRSIDQRNLAYSIADFGHMLMPSYREALHPALRHKVTVIPSPTMPAVNTARPDKPDVDGRFRLLYTGRLTFEKDVHVLFKAFSQIQGRHPNWDLHIVGSGPDLESLERQIDQEELQNRVVLHGVVKDIKAVYDHYINASIYALPSRSEGCPLALREAMARGLPVVGFESCTGTNEIIETGRNGILARADNKVERLAEAIADLMGDPKRRCALGRQGILDVRRYEPDRIHVAWEDLLQRASERKDFFRRWHRSIFIMRHPRLACWALRNARAIKNRGNVRFTYLIPISVKERSKIRRRHPMDYPLLFGCLLFDPRYYTDQHPEVKKAGLDPLLHYLEEGWRNTWEPSEHFSPDYYVRTAKISGTHNNPLVHYYRYGRFEDLAFNAVQPPNLMPRLEKERNEDQAANSENWGHRELAAVLKGPPFWSRAPQRRAQQSLHGVRKRNAKSGRGAQRDFTSACS